jgi:acyl-CoA synthetase (AMP-forming)/AMP-acid ligase II
MMGEKAGAVVVPQPGARFDVGEFLRHARDQLADFQVPQYVAVRSAVLPRNPGGKVLKPALRTETDGVIRCAEPPGRMGRRLVR